MLDLLVQSIATCLLLYGLYQMGNERTRGPMLAAVSEILWVIVGVVHSIPGLIFLSLVLAIVQLRNWWQWRKAGKPW